MKHHSSSSSSSSVARRLLSIKPDDLDNIEETQVGKVHAHLGKLILSLETRMHEAKCSMMSRDFFDKLMLAVEGGSFKTFNDVKKLEKLLSYIKMAQYSCEATTEPGKPGTIDFDVSFSISSLNSEHEEDADEDSYASESEEKATVFRMVHVINEGQEEVDSPETTLYVEVDGEPLSDIFEDNSQGLQPYEIFSMFLSFALFEMDSFPKTIIVKDLQTDDGSVKRPETAIFTQNKDAVKKLATEIMSYEFKDEDDNGDEEPEDGESCDENEQVRAPSSKKRKRND
jgi:hypothetical protein